MTRDRIPASRGKAPIGAPGLRAAGLSGDGVFLEIASALDGVRTLVVPVARAPVAQEVLVEAVAHGVRNRSLWLEKPQGMEYLGRKRLQRFRILGHDPVSAGDRRDLSGIRGGGR